MVKIYTKVCEKGENVVHKNELTLDHSEYGNLQKLRFHALIAKYRPEGKEIRGTWVITRRGALFLKGKISVPDRVQTYRNAVVAHGDTMVNVSTVMKSEPYWETHADFIERQQDMEFFDLPEVESEDIKVVRKVKKKKGKKYCPHCETQLKIDTRESLNLSGGKITQFDQFYVCPNTVCIGYEEKKL